MIAKHPLDIMRFAAATLLLACVGCEVPTTHRSHERASDSPQSQAMKNRLDPGEHVHPDEILPDWRSPIRIRATGRKYHWHHTYCGDDGTYGTDDDLEIGSNLHLPEGADIEVSITSDDYMYIWSCPKLERREIGIPDLFHDVQFTADSPGNFTLIVDPLCGWTLRHDDQMGSVVVQSRQAFGLWLSQKQKTDRE